MVSCDVQKTNNHIEEICISIEDANNMDPTFSDYTYIKLETNDTCLLENGAAVYIRGSVHSL